MTVSDLTTDALESIKACRLIAGRPVLVMLLLVCTGLLLTPHAARADLAYTPQLYQQELTFREAGLQGDRSQIPALIQSLKTSHNELMIRTVLIALAELGAIDALPTIDQVILVNTDKSTPRPPDVPMMPGVAHFAQAARARLVAEATTVAMPDGPMRAQAKVARFFQELGRSPADVSATAGLYRKQLLANQVWAGLQPMEVYAIEELADMLWFGSYQDYSALPQVQQTDFTLALGAELKVQMAPFSPDVQRTKLTDILAQARGGLPVQQLLLNLGRAAAAQAVADKIAEMDANRKNFKPYAFPLLFQVLRVSGDDAHADLWASFQEHPIAGAPITVIHEHGYGEVGNTHFISGY